LSIENRVTVIAGAAGALGRVVAQRFAEQGARLALVGREAEKLERLARELHLPEDRRLIRASNLANPAEADAVARSVLEKFRRAEILLHLVGGWEAGKPVEQVSADEITAMLRQHLWTTFFTLHAFIPYLRANHWGRVIAVSSPHASHPPGHSGPYAVAKAAQQALMLTLASEVKGTGVTANVLVVRTIDVNHKRDRQRTAENAEWTTPEEIAAMMVCLCSDEAGEINGAQIPLYPSPVETAL
jgi:NAD(P)-dependent dehydrogenase (short-subunit alcohol dehydrogenase family)